MSQALNEHETEFKRSLDMDNKNFESEILHVLKSHMPIEERLKIIAAQGWRRVGMYVHEKALRLFAFIARNALKVIPHLMHFLHSMPLQSVLWKIWGRFSQLIKVKDVNWWHHITDRFGHVRKEFGDWIFRRHGKHNLVVSKLKDVSTLTDKEKLHHVLKEFVGVDGDIQKHHGKAVLQHALDYSPHTFCNV